LAVQPELDIAASTDEPDPTKALSTWGTLIAQA
jgi:hypothetical protein